MDRQWKTPNAQRRTA